MCGDVCHGHGLNGILVFRAGANAGNKHCECKVGGDAVISSMGGILVDAITWTYSEVCPGTSLHAPAVPPR